MSDAKKRNIIIGALCGVLLLMIVGYAAFSSVLKINGTSNINSNWQVEITKIEKTASVGATDKEGSPSYDNEKGLSATFNTDLESPGDYATYKIEITNKGSLDSTLKNITMPENTNDDIVFYLNKDQNDEDIEGALKQDDVLYKSTETGNVGYVYVTVLYKDYEKQQTAQNKTASITITFDFEQKTGSSSDTPINTINMKGIDAEVMGEGSGSDGLYADPTEAGRYVYRGANPNNYITFNNRLFRIISIETDGTIKIMQNGYNSDETMAFDNKTRTSETGYCSQGSAANYGCNVWAATGTYTSANGKYSGAVSADSPIKTYLNGDYYNTKITTNKTAIQPHNFYYGSVTYKNPDLALQILEEKAVSAKSNVGLISASDFVKANSNVDNCGTFASDSDNNTTCKTTNYMVTMLNGSGYYWTLSVYGVGTGGVLYVNGSSGSLSSNSANDSSGLVPSLYLKSDITLSGKGTSGEPYEITNYTT